MAKQNDEREIRVLSVRQPHADEIVFGNKWCENRTWRTNYRGPLAIHASRWDGPSDQPTPGYGETGAIIGMVQLVDVADLFEPGFTMAVLRKIARSRGLSTRRDCMEHVIGPVCFVLADPVALVEPIKCGGKLNIWRKTVNSSQLRSGRPKPSKPSHQRRKRSLAVGSRANYKRRSYFVVEIDEELVGVAETRGGAITEWFDTSEISAGWHR